MNHAYSLIELMLGLAITALMLVIAVPLFSGPIGDSKFHAFAAEMTGNLVMARRYAQVSHRPVWFEFSEDEESYYNCWIEREDGSRELIAQHSKPRDSHIDLTLLPTTMPHPTQAKSIDQALSSTHAPRIHFTHLGSSAASITMTDSQRRAYCAVISPSSGRIRAYLWDADQQDWLAFF